MPMSLMRRMPIGLVEVPTESVACTYSRRYQPRSYIWLWRPNGPDTIGALSGVMRIVLGLILTLVDRLDCEKRLVLTLHMRDLEREPVWTRQVLRFYDIGSLRIDPFPRVCMSHRQLAAEILKPLVQRRQPLPACGMWKKRPEGIGLRRGVLEPIDKAD